jgi:dihydrofolate reductase
MQKPKRRRGPAIQAVIPTRGYGRHCVRETPGMTGRLVYSALQSLDGFLEDVDGRFDWGTPDVELHGYINELEGGIGTHLYGRRMYEVMTYWETVGDGPDVAPVEAAYGRLWRALDKVVYSTTLPEAATPRTRLERTFDPDALRAMKSVADRDLSIGGPDVAGHAFRAGLVDDVHLFVFPVVLGGGKPAVPRDVALQLELVHARTFGSGVVHLHHRVRTD